MGGQHPQKVDTGLLRSEPSPGLILGGAQIGTGYGVCNHGGPQNADSIRAMFAGAREAGIGCVDTAPAYGSSEEWIGKILAEDPQFTVISKTASLAGADSDRSAAALVAAQCRASLSRLGRSSLRGYLVHSCQDLLSPFGDSIWRALLGLREAGLVEKIGASVYEADELSTLTARYDLDLVQVPLNVLDQRLLGTGILADVKAKGVEVHARSVFLQGILLARPESLPAQLRAFEQPLGRLRSVCRERNLSMVQLALGFVRSTKLVDQLVVGFDSEEQMREILASDPEDLSDLDCRGLALSDPRLLNPSKW